MSNEKLIKLRKLMKKHKVQAYLVPSTDAHQSEYVPDIWQRRAWLSGFSGSAGDVAVTLNKAGLWTDSRYHLQAEEELRGSGITLFKMGLPDVPSMQEWLKSQLKQGDRVGIDPRLFSQKQADELEKYLSTWGIELKSVQKNLVDEIWEDQPDFPADPIQPHPEKFTGKSVKEKLKNLRQDLKAETADAHVLSTLDSIAWVFNIRGKDVQYNPVVISYGIVTDDAAFLFTDSQKITRDLKKHFKGIVRSFVKIYQYDEFYKILKRLIKKKTKFWLDPNTTSKWIADIVEEKCEIIWKESPVTRLKAIKNNTEINGLKAAHLRDGVAMIKFLKWIEQQVHMGDVTELSAARQVEKFREEQDLYQGPSFETISSYGEHGAIVHYAVSPETDVELKPEGIFLIDSGGQYLDGTTDITRTIALGTPSAEQKEYFTRVLKGHIQLAMTRFPRNTAGNQLDTIARKALWDVGLNYGHGTGHGIGSYLNVHEGPHGISYYKGIGVPLEPGMIISNEPGYYKTGEYGMRIENIILTVKDEEFSTDESEFYKFENITLCPVDLRLIEKSMLLEQEIDFLNEYHEEVRKKLSSLLDDEHRSWLENATQPI